MLLMLTIWKPILKMEVGSVLFSFNGSPNDNIFVLHGFLLTRLFVLIVIFYKIKSDENDI